MECFLSNQFLSWVAKLSCTLMVIKLNAYVKFSALPILIIMEIDFWLKLVYILESVNFLMIKLLSAKDPVLFSRRLNLSPNSLSMMIKIGRARNFPYALTDPGREIDASCPRWKIQNGDFLPWTWSLVCVETIQKFFPKSLHAQRVKKNIEIYRWSKLFFLKSLN